MMFHETNFPKFGFIFIPVTTYPMNTAELQSELTALEAQLTGDMFKDMDLKDKIHNVKMKLSGTRPMNSEIECVGCGS